MLDSGRKRAQGDKKVVTIIGAGTSIDGDIKSKGAIRVEGCVSGRLQSDDTVVVQNTGRVRAEILAGQVIVSGEVQGNVFAHERIEVSDKARLIGNITSPRVSIAEGVVFEGTCSMKPPGQVKLPTGETAAGPQLLPDVEKKA